MPAGRPTSFQEEYTEQAQRLAELGLTDAEIAQFFDVSVRTLHRWKADHEDFCHSLKIGKAHSDLRVERSLYQKAVGYQFVEQQAFKVRIDAHSEKIEIVDVERHMPPDTTAGIFWLKNRKPGEWRDVKAQEISGPNGAPIPVTRIELIPVEPGNG